MAQLRISVRKRANCLNALRSTGPKSLIGKARSSRNATRHGLSTPLQRSAIIDERIQKIALQLVATSPTPTEQLAAEELALAYIDLQRVQVVQLDLWRRLFDGQDLVPTERAIQALEFWETVKKRAEDSLAWDGPFRKKDWYFMLRMQNFAIKRAEERKSLLDELIRLSRYERLAHSKLTHAKTTLYKIQSQR